MEGCGRHACLVKKPEGQGTSSGCVCPDRLIEAIPEFFDGMTRGAKKLLATKMLYLRMDALQNPRGMNDLQKVGR